MIDSEQLAKLFPPRNMPAKGEACRIRWAIDRLTDLRNRHDSKEWREDVLDATEILLKEVTN